MKIAMIAEHAELQPAGPGAYPARPGARVLSLATELGSAGHDVTVQAGNAAHGASTADAGAARALAAELAQRWQEDPPDLVHAHGLVAGMAAQRSARDLGIPVVQAFSSLPGAQQGSHAASSILTGQARLEEAICRGADAVLTATSQDRTALVRRGVPRTAIRVVPAGVDVARFLPSGPQARRGDRPRLVMIAPLAARQAIATALHALARVPDAELVLAGGPPRTQLARVPEYREVTALARRLRLDGRLRITGHLSQRLAPALMRSADVVLSLTSSEPFAMVALEAMACGVPVIATPSGAQRDAVVHGTTGFLVPPGEPEVLASRIRQLLVTPMLAEACGLAGTTRIRTRYSWERIGRETLDVYSALASAESVAA